MNRKDIKFFIVVSIISFLVICLIYFTLNTSSLIEETKKTIDEVQMENNKKWVLFSEKNPVNKFVYETYFTCHTDQLLCRSATINIATNLHGTEFALEVDKAILESNKLITGNELMDKLQEKKIDKVLFN